ncbi:MAG: hypothetical protein DRN81_04960 [Thermoproteota archaeon]|nr:MAG: hypothetical protein DRN81_04960 [Candidatus Korarchaeota archaeon]
MTVQNLINEIARKTIGNADNIDTDFTNIVLDSIKSALRRLPRFARVKAVIQTTTKQYTATAQSIDISDLTDFVELRTIYYIDSNLRVRVDKKVREEFLDIYTTASSGKPQYYSNLDDDTIEFDRPNDETRTLYLEYYGNTSTITTGSTVSLRDDIIEILKDGALAYVWEHLEDDGKATKSENRFILGLETLEDDTDNDETPDYIVEVYEQ